MNQTNKRTGIPDMRRDAVEAREALAMAIKKTGIQLPALDMLSVGAEQRLRYGLVELGICSAPVARLLAEVIDRGAER